MTTTFDTPPPPEALQAAVAALDARDEEWERALAGLKLYTHETEEPCN